MTGIKTLYNTTDKPTGAGIPVHNQPMTSQEEKAQIKKEQNNKFLAGVLQNNLKDIWQRSGEYKWAGFEAQYRSETDFNDDGTANINRPLEKATIRNKMADELSMKPIVTLKPQEPSDIYKVNFIKPVWDFVWVEADTDKNLIDLHLCKNIWGTGWWYEGLMTVTHTKYVPVTREDGKIDSEKKIITRSWLAGYTLDIRDVWVDPVSDIELADYCFIRDRQVSYERLKGFKHDPNYFGIDDALKAMSDTSDPPEFQNETEQTKSSTRRDKYCLWHYFSKSKGQYIVAVGTVSGNIMKIIRNGANPYAHGELPISPAVDHKKYKEMYGYGECELLETSKYELNSIENQIVDYARESNTINFMVGNGVTFQDSELVGGVMRVWNFKGDLNNAQMAKPPSMDAALSNVRDMLENNATVDTGIDNRALMGNPTKTAFEARLQEQNKLKGINVSMKNMDIFYQRVFRQRLSNIQQFMPTTTGKKIVGNKDISVPGTEEEKRYRSIPIEGFEIDEPKNVAKGTKAEGVPRMKPKKGIVSFLELKPSILRNNLDIHVETPTTSPVLRDIEKEEKQQAIREVLEIAMANPEILQELDLRSIIKEKITDYDINPDDFMQSRETQDLQDVRQSVLDKLPQPPQAKEQPQRAKAPIPQANLTVQPPNQNPNAQMAPQ